MAGRKGGKARLVLLEVVAHDGQAARAQPVVGHQLVAGLVVAAQPYPHQRQVPATRTHSPIFRNMKASVGMCLMIYIAQDGHADCPRNLLAGCPGQQLAYRLIWKQQSR